MDTITFYSTRGPYGGFSNFSNHGFWFDGHWCETSEHAFQACKFKEQRFKALVRACKGPAAAARCGRDRSMPLRPDWELLVAKSHHWSGLGRGDLPEMPVKDWEMLEVLRAKFYTHADLRQTLLDTGNAKLIEASPVDAYWGWGPDKCGKNRLGELLMILRDHEWRVNGH